MIRFDLAVDANLKVYLMEANLGPNLAYAQYPENKLLFEKVVYNYLVLVGLGSRFSRESLRPLSTEYELILSSDRNIVINAEECVKPQCFSSCEPIECRFCIKCLSPNDKQELHDAYREFTNIGEMKRLIPAPFERNKGLNMTELKKLSPRNQFMTRWYYGKCVMVKEWCGFI